MGIRGLTTFIDNRSSQYLRRYALHDTNLVIDGNNIACQLYKWHCKVNDCFGGDYDKFSKVVYDFFKLLSDCNITPLVIFDGAYEKRKLKTVFHRMRNRISAAKDLNSVSEDRVSMFPLFSREVFVDVVLKLGLKCVRCEFESDNDAAHLAMALQCPILSYDSDFYIFDVMYIPFSSMELKVRKETITRVNYIPCRLYRVENFLQSFGGLDKINLPLLAVMLGNDYITKRTFSVFYRQLKRVKTVGNEQQTLIKSVITWLKNETPESALRKILGRYKLHKRRKLAWKIKKAIEAYQSGDSQICLDFNIHQNNVQKNIINVPKPEDIEESGEDESESSSEEEEELEDSQPVLKYSIPNFFRANFKKCLYPSSFMDMLVSDTYYCIPQIEDFSSEHSHNISVEILTAIHKILTFPKTKNLIIVARNEHSHIKKTPAPIYEKPVPKLIDIEGMDAQTGRSVFLNILNIQDNTCNNFPNSWHLFLLSIKYWVTNSKTKVGLPYIYAAILCAIVTNFVDQKIGFCRSTRSFSAKYPANSTNVQKKAESSKTINEALDKLDRDDCVSCMAKLIGYFQMDFKMKSNIKLFDRSIVHDFAQFQSCLLHIKHLNSLLNFPYRSLTISDFYDGTFLYNMSTNLSKRKDLKAYVRVLLDDCPEVLNVFELMIDAIQDDVLSNADVYEAPKRRKKNKKKVNKDFVPDEVIPANEDFDDYDFDENNKYSLLAFMNK